MSPPTEAGAGVLGRGRRPYGGGPTEQKAKNLAADPHCSLLTGNGTRLEGLDLVVERTAVRVTDDALLRRPADEWVRKYGEDWRYSQTRFTFPAPAA